MKSVMLIVACVALLAFIAWRERKDQRNRHSRQAMIDQLQANSRRFLNELMGDEQTYDLPVRAVVMPSNCGSKLLWEVKAKNDAERADTISKSPVFAPSIWRDL